jgi:hypothetical protein
LSQVQVYNSQLTFVEMYSKIERIKREHVESFVWKTFELSHKNNWVSVGAAQIHRNFTFEECVQFLFKD